MCFLFSLKLLSASVRSVALTSGWAVSGHLEEGQWARANQTVELERGGVDAEDTAPFEYRFAGFAGLVQFVARVFVPHQSVVLARIRHANRIEFTFFQYQILALFARTLPVRWEATILRWEIHVRWLAVADPIVVLVTRVEKLILWAHSRDVKRDSCAFVMMIAFFQLRKAHVGFAYDLTIGLDNRQSDEKDRESRRRHHRRRRRCIAGNEFDSHAKLEQDCSVRARSERKRLVCRFISQLDLDKRNASRVR